MRQYLKYPLYFVLLITTVFSATRVAYLRPGPMMKIPFTSVRQSPYLFTAGFGSELHNLAPLTLREGLL